MIINQDKIALWQNNKIILFYRSNFTSEYWHSFSYNIILQGRGLPTSSS
jgi:hypothetical protein